MNELGFLLNILVTGPLSLFIALIYATISNQQMPETLVFRIKRVLLTYFGQFPQDKSFMKKCTILNVVNSIRKHLSWGNDPKLILQYFVF